MNRFQFVWWPWRGGWYFTRFDGSWAKVYDWSLRVGPVEIRKWHGTPPSRRGATPRGESNAG